MNKNLTNLENHIYNSIPRLRELSSGCEINSYGIKYIVLDQMNINKYLCINDDFEISKRAISDNETIGHPILLNDVLEWMKSLDILYTDYEKLLWDLFTMGLWDVTKPALREQNQELIDALTELIPKDNEKQK